MNTRIKHVLGGWLAVWGFLTMGSPVLAQTDAAAWFRKGHAAYQQADYAGTLTAWQQAASSGARSLALYYNMGSAYYRQGQTGQAIRYYRKALEISPSDARTLHSLGIARKKVKDAIPVLPANPFTAAWDWLILHLGTGVLFALGLLLYAGVVGLLAHWIWFRGEFPWRRRALMVGAPVAVLVLAGSLWGSQRRSANRAAVVLSASTELRSAASESARNQRTIHEGAELQVLTESGAWRFVRLTNGETGWLKRNTMGDV